MNNNEQFVQIRDYNNYYVSNQGRVYNKKSKRFIGADNGHGYVFVGLSKDGVVQYFTAHQLVMQYFGPPQPEGKNEIDHINHIRTDNRIENLRWVTPSENGKNKASHKGIEYEYFDEIPADYEDIIEVRDYGDHEFEDLYYADNFFYFDTGVSFRRLHIGYLKNGSAYVWAYDTDNKITAICYTKFKKLYGLN